MSNDPPTRPWSQFWVIIAGLVGIGVVAIVGGHWANEPAAAELVAAGVVFILTGMTLTVMALVRAQRRNRGG